MSIKFDIIRANKGWRVIAQHPEWSVPVYDWIRINNSGYVAAIINDSCYFFDLVGKVIPRSQQDKSIELRLEDRETWAIYDEDGDCLLGRLFDTRGEADQHCTRGQVPVKVIISE